jgi:hypothetical protein
MEFGKKIIDPELTLEILATTEWEGTDNKILFHGGKAELHEPNRPAQTLHYHTQQGTIRLHDDKERMITRLQLHEGPYKAAPQGETHNYKYKLQTEPLTQTIIQTREFYGHKMTNSEFARKQNGSQEETY